jgi:hypothetical protein
MQKWEYLNVETRSLPASGSAVMFFDHYAKEYKGQKSDLDTYFVKLNTEGWKLTMALYDDSRTNHVYLFRRPARNHGCLK